MASSIFKRAIKSALTRVGRVYPLPLILDRLSTRFLGTITHVVTDSNVMALTFDDGPDPRYTPLVLDTLGEFGARATFFVVGKRANRHPDIIQRMLNEGHAVGNHTWSHPALPLIEPAQRRKEIRLCADALAQGNSKRLLRPPFGYQSNSSRIDILRTRHKVITWNAAADDCSDLSPRAMADHVIADARPGNIVLMHDSLYATDDPSYSDRRPMLEALRIILETLGATYQFVNLEELLERGRPQRTTWIRKPSKTLMGKLVYADAERQDA